MTLGWPQRAAGAGRAFAQCALLRVQRHCQQNKAEHCNKRYIMFRYIMSLRRKYSDTHVATDGSTLAWRHRAFVTGWLEVQETCRSPIGQTRDWGWPTCRWMNIRIRISWQIHPTPQVRAWRTIKGGQCRKQGIETLTIVTQQTKQSVAFLHKPDILRSQGKH